MIWANDLDDRNIIRLPSRSFGPRDHSVALWAAITAIVAHHVAFIGLAVIDAIVLGLGLNSEFANQADIEAWVRTHTAEFFWSLTAHFFVLKVVSAFVALLAIVNIFHRASPTLTITYFVLGYILFNPLLSRIGVPVVWVGSSGVALVSLAFYLWFERKLR